MPNDLPPTFDWTSGSGALASGIHLHWEEAGPPGAEVALLVMGLGGQLIHWPDALCTELLRRGFRVIRFDNRDAGLSGEVDRGIRINLARDWLLSRFGRQSPANYSLLDMSDDAIGLLDLLGIARAHWVGVSMGGMISQITAARHPQRVASLTSIMSTTNDPKLPPARFDVLWRMGRLGPQPTRREAVIRRAVSMARRIGSPGYPIPTQTLADTAGRAYDRAFRPDGVARHTHAVVSTGSFEELLSGILMPTQIIHGLDDPLLRAACGMRSAELIPGARLELIPGMGHDMPAALMPRWAELIAENAGRA